MHFYDLKRNFSQRTEMNKSNCSFLNKIELSVMRGVLTICESRMSEKETVSYKIKKVIEEIFKVCYRKQTN